MRIDYDVVWTGASWRENPPPIHASSLPKVNGRTLTVELPGDRGGKMRRIRQNDSRTAIRAERKARGQCVDCGESSPTYRCRGCRTRGRQHGMTIHNSTTLRQRRHAAGRCVDCNVPSETYRCLECRGDLLERERARRERRKQAQTA